MSLSRKSNPLRKVADLVAQNSNKSNDTDSLKYKGQDIGIPNNVPTAIIGEKGSGKTTLIKSLMSVINEEQEFRNIFYLYSSLTLDLELPDYVIRIDIDKAEDFLLQFFEIKSIYNSYVKLFTKLRKMKYFEEDKDDLKGFLGLLDNEIVRYNTDVINTGKDPHVIIDRVLDVGKKLIETYSKEFEVDGVKINGFKKEQRDAFFIDDIAVASRILFKDRRSNSLYEYITLSRHMRILIVFAGQQVDQIPKMIRREIMCWILTKSTTLDLLTGIISKQSLRDIETKQRQLMAYEFVLYNVVTGKITIL